MRSQCPAHYDPLLPSCSAANPNQHPIDAKRLRAAGAEGDWLSGAIIMQCRWCKCVYSDGIVRGRFEDGVWTSWDHCI